MYELNLSRGAYRMLFWLQEKHPNIKLLKSGEGGWVKLAMADLNYSQPMVCVIAKELVRAGVFKKTTSGFLVCR